MKRSLLLGFLVMSIAMLTIRVIISAEANLEKDKKAKKSLSIITNSIGMKLVLLPAGEFEMGRPGAGQASAKPVHSVRITKPFWMSVYEVTQKEYVAMGSNNVSRWASPLMPVQDVSWGRAVEFCLKLSEKEGVTYRLPTEAEWEYACRANTGDMYIIGESPNHAWYKGNSEMKPHPGGQKKANAWGLHDMYGNVWEWCADKYSRSYYRKSRLEDPLGPEYGMDRVLRGGAWNSYSCATSAFYRYSLPPIFSGVVGGDVGFRVVRECE